MDIKSFVHQMIDNQANHLQNATITFKTMEPIQQSLRTYQLIRKGGSSLFVQAYCHNSAVTTVWFPKRLRGADLIRVYNGYAYFRASRIYGIVYPQGYFGRVAREFSETFEGWKYIGTYGTFYRDDIGRVTVRRRKKNNAIVRVMI